MTTSVLVIGLLALTGVLAISAFAAPKNQVASFGSPGNGPGQFGASTTFASIGPQGVAINATGAGGVGVGDIYVVDTTNSRVDRFNAEGDYLGSFGSLGSGNGQFSLPQGIAIDQSSGSVYVTDRENRRVVKFTARGEFLRTWGWGVLNGAEAFQICTSAQTCQAGSGGLTTAAGPGRMATGTASPRVAVDQTSGDVYVTDPGNRRVQVFQPSGEFVRAFGWGVRDGASAFQVCTTETGCRGGSTATGTAAGQFGANAPSLIAIDSTASPHVAYLSDVNASNRVQRIDLSTPSAPTPMAPIGVPPLLNAVTSGLAIDGSSGDLLVARDPTAGESLVQEISNPANTVAPLPAVSDTHAAGEGWTGTNSVGSLGLIGDIAVDASSGDIYVTRPGVQQVAILAAGGTQPTASVPTVAANTTGNTATLNGVVGPNGSQTSYRFEYRLCPGGTCGSGAFVSVPSPEGSVGSGTGSVAVTQPIAGLAAGSTYEAVLTADGYGAPVTSAPLQFSTPAVPPALGARPAAPVAATTATLQASIDPRNAPTSYYFEYTTDGEFQSRGYTGASVAPVPPANLAAGIEPVVVSTPVAGLTAQTTYHFRVVAENGVGGPQFGADQTFITRALPVSPGGEPCANEALRVGLSAALPDCRAYELVSPADKVGGQGIGSYIFGNDGNAFPPSSPSLDGERAISFSVAGNLVPGEAIYSTDTILSERTPEGWVSHSPYTHKDLNEAGGASASLNPAAADGSLGRMVYWTSGPGADLFPEQKGWPTNVSSLYLSDWGGAWQSLGPYDPSIVGLEAESAAAISEDGSVAVYRTLNGRGMLGPEDPYLDLTTGSNAGSALYAYDAGGSLSDQFHVPGKLRAVAVCTGGGANRTVLPSLDATGKMSPRTCPAALNGRSAALINSGGAAIGRLSSSILSTTKNTVSADGSRIFFMSPDPKVPTPATCTGSGAATQCPTQVYLTQTGPGGERTVRWISRSEVPGQDGSLTGKAFYQGASKTGDRVFFQTSSPLTANDPNGTGSTPAVNGTAYNLSWDLYAYDVPSDSSGRPDATDPGQGSLTRISAGPTGTGDCNVSPGLLSTAGTSGAGYASSLRFAAEDGERVYFTCSAPLAGVPTNQAPTDGTITTAGGSVASAEAANLYLYDAAKPLAKRWEFIARLPRAVEGWSACATNSGAQGQTLMINGAIESKYATQKDNCFRGTADGRFVTFATPGRLTADDPGDGAVDLYAFDEVKDELIRLDAPQGGTGGSYGCEGLVSAPTGRCYGDGGFGGSITPLAGVVTEPADPDSHIAFFQTKSRLVPADTDDQYDVYEWNNGHLALLSPSSGGKGSYYAGNSADGRDVLIMTRDQLTPADGDAVMDVYDARRGGGFAEPAPPAACDPLGESCTGPPAPPPAVPPNGSASFSGPGDPVPAGKQAKPKKKNHKKKNHKKKQQQKKTGKGKKKNGADQRRAGDNRGAGR